MGPIRTQPSHRKHLKPTPHSRAKRAHTQPNPDESIQSTPGVQKLKASLRQAQRLLAKDNLAADVRVETERRLKSLEADLTKAERARKERAFAVRYHKIKFFERQKVTRKIAQTKKRIAELGKGKKEKKLKPELEKALMDLRIDLNYILHYPKLKKYVSLFPPEVRNGPATTPTSAETSATAAERQEVLNWIRSRMEKGELSNEPEITGSESTGAEMQGTWDATSEKQHRNRANRVPESDEDDPFFGVDDVP